MYLGIGFLISGLIMLIWILFEASRNNKTFLESELLDICVPAGLESRYKVKPINNTKHLQYIEYPKRNSMRAPSVNVKVIPKSVINAYGKENLKSILKQKKTGDQIIKQPISHNDVYKDQAARILSRFKLGRSVLEIAQELGIERDSVAFALNLGSLRRMNSD